MPEPISQSAGKAASQSAGVCVVGAGYWGPNLIRNFYTLPGQPLKAVCDLDPGRLAYVQRNYPGVHTGTDLATFLDDPSLDAFVIATPAASHYALARQTLLAGKHALVEKPLALTSREAADLVALAAQAGRVLMVGHTFEYSPPVQKLKELVSSGTLGQIFYLYGSRLNLGQVRQDVNALWNLAPHDISIVLSLLGQMPTQVNARGYCYLQPGIEDVVFLNLDFPGGIGVSLHVSWLDPGKVRRLTVVGSEKMVVYDDTNAEMPIQIFDKGVTRQAPTFESFGEFRLLLRAGDIYIPRVEATEPLRHECQHFLRCIAGEETCRTDGRAGLAVVRVLEAASLSLQQAGAPVTIQP